MKQLIKFLNFILLFLVFLPKISFADNPYQMELSVKNILKVEDKVYFDLYVRQTGPKPILLSFSDFMFELSSNENGIKLNWVPGSMNLWSKSGLKVNPSNCFAFNIIEKDGTKIIVINDDPSLNLNPQNWSHLIANIDSRPNKHRIGRFYVSNLFGSEFDLQMRQNKCCFNTKVFSFNVSNNLSAQIVDIVFKKPEPGDEQILKSFLTDKSGNNIKLQWESSWEKTISCYRIFKSYDGIKWSLLTQLQARNKNESSEVYEVSDFLGNFESDKIFYKIEFIDIEGVSSMTEPKKVKIIEDLSFKIYPNPAKKEVTLEPYKPKGGFNLIMYDISGRLVFYKWFDGEDPKITLDLYPLSSGTYIIKLERGKETYSDKLVVIK